MLKVNQEKLFLLSQDVDLIGIRESLPSFYGNATEVGVAGNSNIQSQTLLRDNLGVSDYYITI